MGFKVLSFHQFKHILVHEKHHYHSEVIDYIEEYLGKKLSPPAEFMVIEDDYLSRDYLTDYANYYIYSFNSAEYAKCMRVHFFAYPNKDAKDFEENFSCFILNDSCKEGQNVSFWEKNYLGFTVITPIPNKTFGFTILKTQQVPKETPAYERVFWGTKDYKVNLFGNEMIIRSLGFQKQDANVGACATIAIWTMLEIAKEDYNITLKSPLEITKDAGLGTFFKRQFPSMGLEPEQMCTAIAKNYLIPKRYEQEDHFNLLIQRVCHAYSHIKIPIILNISIKVNTKVVKHSIAICGHRLNDWSNLLAKIQEKMIEWAESSERQSIIWFAERISKIYVHDDQMGPFVNMEFVGGKELKSTSYDYIEGESLIVALYPKIGILLEDIEQETLNWNMLIYRFFKQIAESNEVPLKLHPNNLIWDTQLFSSRDYKKKMRNSVLLNTKIPRHKKFKTHFLTSILPEYIWVMNMYLRIETEVTEEIVLIFDASGLLNSPLLIDIWIYDESINEKLYYYLSFLEKSQPKLINKTIRGDITTVLAALSNSIDYNKSM